MKDLDLRLHVKRLLSRQDGQIEIADSYYKIRPTPISLHILQQVKKNDILKIKGLSSLVIENIDSFVSNDVLTAIITCR